MAWLFQPLLPGGAQQQASAGSPVVGDLSANITPSLSAAGALALAAALSANVSPTLSGVGTVAIAGALNQTVSLSLNASGVDPDNAVSLVPTEILFMAQYGFMTAAEPFKIADAVTPSDATVFSHFTDAVYVGGAGNLAVRMKDGQTVTFTGVVAGSTLLIQVDKVMSTNTTATSILALYRGKL